MIKIPDTAKILFVISLFLMANSELEGQEISASKDSYRNNLIKLNVIPIIPIINGHNQKWMGVEYERFLSQKLSFAALMDVGLFEDYSFIKYHDFFEEHGGFSYTRQDVTTLGYHFIPSVKDYFLILGKVKGQGIYLGGNLDLNQYFKKTETFVSATNHYDHKNYSTTRLSIGTTLGGQYIAFSRIVIDLNISIFAKLFAINSGGKQAEIDPLHATWTFYSDDAWSTVNLMLGYAFGGGKRK